jgi:RimJ/RimL family protein N-acetyltransferase
LRFLLQVTSPIRLLRSSELRGVAAHIERHALESGRGEDLVFAPFMEFDREAYQESRHDSWRRAVDVPGWERCWAYLEGDRVVGHADLTGAALYSGLHRARLGIGVERKFRGQGKGGELLQAVIEWARREPELAWIDLSVFAHNVRAKQLYERHGFREVGRTLDAYRLNGLSIDDVHMVLSVDGVLR